MQRRVAATPRLRRGRSVKTSRGDAAAATDVPWRRVTPQVLRRWNRDVLVGRCRAAARAFKHTGLGPPYERSRGHVVDRGTRRPNVHTAGLEYGCGIAEHCGALWPNRWIETFTEGLQREGVESPVILTRAGWAGMQTTGAVLWSSRAGVETIDTQGATFTLLRAGRTSRPRSNRSESRSASASQP